MLAANVKEPVININGFNDPKHKLKLVRFTNIKLPENAQVKINDAHDVHFLGVTTVTGSKPNYTQTNSTGVQF
ncbi:MAG: hypothetical protein EOO88_37530 [Pedobacter sp.]|nr:MAG: hypothetical protein EOO88_37530 [Pedobacter sp.]